MSSRPIATRPHPRVLTVILAAGLTVTAAIGTASVAAAGAGSPAASRPPKQLLTIEEQAEDIGDRAPGKRWARIAADVAAVRAAWRAFQARAKADGINASLLGDFDGALAKLRAAAKAKRVADTLQSANDLSRATVELLGSYDIGHPVEVGRLDVIGRQILLDLERGDRAGVGEQIHAARTQWDAIRADVTGRSANVAAQVDATLAALEEANVAENDGLLKAEIRALLETVDALEELY